MAQIAVVLGAVAVYEAARLAMEPNWAQSFTNARRIVSLEEVLGVAWEQSLQRAFLAMPDLVTALNIFYFVGHFLITGVFFLWLYHRSRDGFRSFRDGFLVATAIAVVIHWLYPTAPPRLAEDGIEDTLRVLSGIDIGSPNSSALSNPVAAVPSLHAAYARRGRDRPAPLRPLVAAPRRRGDLPAARRAHDRRHGQPLRARRRRGHGRARRRLRARQAGARPGEIGRSAPLRGVARPPRSLKRPSLQWTPRRGVEQSGSSPGS